MRVGGELRRNAQLHYVVLGIMHFHASQPAPIRDLCAIPLMLLAHYKTYRSLLALHIHYRKLVLPRVGQYL